LKEPAKPSQLPWLTQPRRHRGKRGPDHREPRNQKNGSPSVTASPGRRLAPHRGGTRADCPERERRERK
jgi:hypothetical protein